MFFLFAMCMCLLMSFVTDTVTGTEKKLKKSVHGGTDGLFHTV